MASISDVLFLILFADGTNVLFAFLAKVPGWFHVSGSVSIPLSATGGQQCGSRTHVNTQLWIEGVSNSAWQANRWDLFPISIKSILLLCKWHIHTQ